MEGQLLHERAHNEQLRESRGDLWLVRGLRVQSLTLGLSGQRVQNSVFECLLDAAQCKQLQHKLLGIMDKEKDSLRFYYLGNNYETRIEHFGSKAGYAPEGALIV